nr:hypothetical protein [Tanacetum cinerariifolium]
PGPEAPPSPDYIPGPEYPEYPPPADDVLLAEEQPLPAVVSPTAESPGYITESEPEMEPEEEDGDNEKSEEDSIEYPTSGRDDDADDEDEEESSDSEEEEEEHLALTVPAPALYSSISAFEESEPFEEGETTATPPPFGYLSPTSYQLPPFRMPLPIFTPLPTSSFPLPSSLPSTSGSESIPEADIPLRKRACFTTPTGEYEEVAHSRDYCTQIMDYCQLREVHTSTLVTQVEALQRDVSTLQRQHIDDEDRLTRHIQHEHAQRDVAPEDGDSCS